MKGTERKLSWRYDPESERTLLGREWLVTNGLGGFAAGTLAGVATRRYHGLLVSALPSPCGRTVMLGPVTEQIRLPDGASVSFGGREYASGRLELFGASHLAEFRLDEGLPVWRYEVGGYEIERRVFMPHMQNTVYIRYRLLSGDGSLRLRVRPAIHFRHYEAPVSAPLGDPYVFTATEGRYEIRGDESLPPLRLRFFARNHQFSVHEEVLSEQLYRVERSRGYDAEGSLFSPGHFGADLSVDSDATLAVSTEPWEAFTCFDPQEAHASERERRRHLLAIAHPSARDGVAGELVLAADQFIVTPPGRTAEKARARARGDEPRSVIAGYHWFTDWGRDTMISLEGLTLVTGRHAEAGQILRTFARYVRDGLLPNLFPDGENEGLYHTADATLWFFHAIDRYVSTTGDRDTLRQLLPVLESIVTQHVNGTRFGIGVDERDGLLRQGAEGYQLTWMDAKVGDWVVTPRRGKAVEINALWYNALRLLERWLREEGAEGDAAEIARLAARAYGSFNRRFWCEERGHLYDVVDGEDGDDAACRPNQIFAVALPHPVLDESRWGAVVEVVRERLLTPVGLRSLAPGEPGYHARYFGDLRSRDAAYHQGTAWGWLIGPFVDAFLRTHPERRDEGRSFLEGFVDHLDDACIGSISEIFDGDRPWTPRGCVAQAWSVAEVLRAWVATGSS